MAQVINTNSLSLMTQNNMNASQSSLNTAIQRLSSGLRINSAKDDAAGQAIANRFTANIKGLTQAARNANDGISMTQTTEGALTEINNNLQRVRELTVQASTGSNSDSDLTSIQAEIQQRLEEIDRVSGQTQFNGVKVLAQDNTMKVQVGANDGETITVDLKKVDAKSLGLDNFKIDGARQATAGDLISRFKATGTDNYTGGYTVDINSGAVKTGANAVYVSAANGSLVTTATVANTVSAVYDTTASANGTATSLATLGAGKAAGDKLSFDGFEFTVGTADANGNGTYTAKVDGKTVTFTIAASTDATGTAATIATSVNLYTSQTGTLTTNSTTANRAAVASDLDVAGQTKTGSTLTAGGVVYSVDVDGQVKNGGGNVMYLSKTAGGTPTLITDAVAASEKSSSDPLAKLDAALASVDQLRSDLGAVQNRFESTIANLNNTVNNLSAARSRIQDADYATEVSNMTRAQILQQAGTSVLAQANQTTQGVLSLLR
ncbi:flagellin N-terminal helical domain-containing protein [Cupriavidus necator]